ncbi:MAG: hypothetical protein ACFB2W_23040 [Leptolyngbyaceae cyanobacterium]
MDPERIESVKVGLIAAIVGIAASLVLSSIDILFIEDTSFTQTVSNLLVAQVVHVAIAAVCCFLFGVTYRYIIRQDSNPHLRSGAVGAFALTRSLSQLESVDLSELASVLPLSIPIVESFGLFLTVRLVLDLGLKQQWLKPFITVPSGRE